VDSPKKARLEDLCMLDKLEEERGLDFEKLLRKSLIVSYLERIILHEEISWKKYRVLWL
jgi:hypothetical protein